MRSQSAAEKIRSAAARVAGDLVVRERSRTGRTPRALFDTPPSPQTWPARLGLFALLGLSLCLPSLSQAASPLVTPKAPTFPAATGEPGKRLGGMRLSNPDQLIGGPAATGRVGDWMLYNDVIKLVIDDIPRATGFARSGGNIIDADKLSGGNDQLAQVFTYLDNTFPRHLIYDKIYLTRNGSDNEMAELVVTGVDSANPMLVGVTRYQLERGQAWVRIITQITNYSGETLRSYEVGDSLQWGMTEHFVPGYGAQVSGRTTQSTWVAGVGGLVSYGLTSLGQPLWGPHGSGWSDMVAGRVNLARGATVSFERYFLVGDGDTASLVTQVNRLRKPANPAELTEQVTGKVVETAKRLPVAGARVEARFASNNKPVSFALTDEQGRYTLELPPNEYKFQATHRARGARPSVAVDLTRGQPPAVTLELTPAARLLFRVEERDKGSIPCKLTFVGKEGTPDPEFGHKSQTPGALNTWFALDGKGEILVPPGTYEITASRGIEYSIRKEVVKLQAEKEHLFAVVLEHEVDTGAYVSADFNQQGQGSADSWTRPRDVIVANLAEGVEMIAATDTDLVTDYSGLLQSMELESRLKVIPGQEVTTRAYGSFIAFPMEVKPEAPGNGAILAGELTPDAIFGALRADGEARIIQVNQPREGQEGYFNLMELDPQTAIPGDGRFSLGFNTLEVISGKRMKDASMVLRDWFLLLNKGYVFTALGNSDSRTVVGQERGYPRNFIGIYSDNPGRVANEAVVQAVRDRHDVVVSNGPFIRVTLNGVGRVGSLNKVPESAPGQGAPVNLEVEVQAPRWIRVDEIEVVANGEVVRRLTAPAPDQVVKFRGTIDLKPTRDTWYVVIARGNESLEPVVPRYKGTTITPFAFTNPIWVDVDGDNAFTPLFPRDKAEKGYVEMPLERAE